MLQEPARCVMFGALAHAKFRCTAVLFSMIVAALWASHYSMMAAVWAQRQLFFSVRQWLLSDAMRKYKQKEKPSVRQCDEVSVRQYMVPKPSTVAEAARQERVKKEERLAIPPPVPPDNIGTSRRIYRRRLRRVIAAPPLCHIVADLSSRSSSRKKEFLVPLDLPLERRRSLPPSGRHTETSGHAYGFSVIKRASRAHAKTGFYLLVYHSSLKMEVMGYVDVNY
jgi:hypothetical protein